MAGKEKTLWDRLTARFLNMKFGVIVVALITVLGAVGKFTDFFKEVRPERTSSLQIVGLSEKGSVEPLDGHPSGLMLAGESAYAGGFKVRLRLSNDKQSRHTITVDGLSLVIDSYTSLVELPPTYQIDPMNAPPQGTVIPNRFMVAVRGTNLDQASWIPPEAGASPLSVKDRQNLLTTDPPRVLKLKADSDDSEDCVGTIVMAQPGAYRVHFNFRYSVNGRVFEKATEGVLVFAQ